MVGRLGGLVGGGGARELGREDGLVARTKKKDGSYGLKILMLGMQ